MKSFLESVFWVSPELCEMFSSCIFCMQEDIDTVLAKVAIPRAKELRQRELVDRINQHVSLIGLKFCM